MESMETKIIFEDSDILVLDKPSGMIVNRSDTTKGETTIQDWVERYLKIRIPKSEIRNKLEIQNSNVQNDFEFRNSDFEFSKRAGIVHRLDKETSGILLVAKTPQAFENLQKQFKERAIKKVYIALVHGKVDSKEGEINVSVGRLPWNRKRFGVLAGGREAVTKYRTIFNFQFSIFNEQLTFLELYPQTGRTHQIRVHLKYFGHPVFSDPLYGGRKTARNDRKVLSRIFLHAAKISIHHPKTGEIASFESKLPEELGQFLDKLHS
jgi:23S rRNA pseudouridine1911/1915/1917 synthase